jgi:hypothetical protein
MSFFVLPTPSPKPKNSSIQKISLIVAVLFLVMVVAQLFTFEKFPEVIKAYGLPWNTELSAALRAGLLVIFEVMSLPFLLFMSLSPLARTLSMISGWIVALWWIGAALWATTHGFSGNIGFLGATINLTSSWLALLASLILGALVARVSWGMWPLAVKPKK